jgi:hypothetical protein
MSAQECTERHRQSVPEGRAVLAERVQCTGLASHALCQPPSRYEQRQRERERMRSEVNTRIRRKHSDP